jgi:hypothetical protein
LVQQLKKKKYKNTILVRTTANEDVGTEPGKCHLQIPAAGAVHVPIST